MGQRYPDVGLLTFVNNGSIAATLGQPYEAAVSLRYGSQAVTNNGSIVASGGRGLDLSFGTLTNTGSISASGDAVTSFNTVLVNTGSIVSTGGVGFVGSGSQTVETNSGTISGAVAGARFGNITLINTGTISSPGVGVALDDSAVLENRAGGVINGGVGPASPFGYSATYQARLVNAGTINGNVDFGNSPYASYYGSSNIFVASPGGVVNGNLFLGNGNDVFVTSLTNTGPGAFAGVTGTVGGTGTETIRYIADTSTSAVVAAAGVFSRVGYELSAGTTLTLTAPVAQSLGLEFVGSGTVDLTADLSQTNATIIDLTAQSALLPQYPRVSNAVALTSRGTLTATSTLSVLYYAPPAVQLTDGSSFTNAGTIVLRSAGAGLVGIAGGGSVTNAGTISLDGATAISGSGSGALTVINSGSIAQVIGGAAGNGIVAATAVTNGGSIDVGGAAIVLGSYGSSVVTNNGTLRSTGGAAIVSNPYAYGNLNLTNAAGATIAGVGQSLVLAAGAAIDNYGAISGDVVLGCMTPYCYSNAPSSYVAHAGSSLTGNLIFGSGDDTFVSLDDATGVTGTISGGAGVDTYGRAYSASTTVVAGTGLPASFEREGIGANGAATVVTVTGPPGGLDRDLFFFGDGQIVNRADVNRADPRSAPYAVTLGSPTNLPGVGSTLAFINEAAIGGGVSGTARSFTNSGTISATNEADATVALGTLVGPFDFVNSGTITATAGCLSIYGTSYCFASPSVVLGNSTYLATNGAVTFANSGTLIGAISIAVAPTSLTLENTGTIADVAGAPYQQRNYISIFAPDGFNTDLVALSNRGTIGNGLIFSGPTRNLTINNSGTLGSADLSAVYAVQNTRQVLDPTTGLFGTADQDGATLTNSGTVTGAIWLETRATATTLVNSGTVTRSAQQPAPGGAAIYSVARTVGNQTVTVDNRGVVTDPATAGGALVVNSFAAPPEGPGPQVVPVAGGPTATISITNSGVLRADGGGVVTLGTEYDAGDRLIAAKGLSAVATSVGASRVTITNAAGATISAIGEPSLDTGPGPVTGGFARGGSVAVFASATSVAITNAGTISGGSGTTVDPGSTILLPGTLADLGRYLAGAVATVGSVDTLVNTTTGVITGSVDLGTGDDRIENFGTVAGDVYLRDGDDTFVQALAGTLTGIADGGTGNNTLILDATGGGALTQTLLDRFVNFTAPTLQGSGTITATGQLRLPTLSYTGGALTIAAGSTLATSGPVTITTGDADVAITNLGTVAGSIALGGGLNRIDNRGTIGGGVALGGGSSTVANTGTIARGVTGGAGPVALTNDGTITGGVILGDGAAQVTNSGRIDQIVFGNGSDALVNTGTIDGAITFGNGSSTLTNGGTLGGPVRFGGGATTVTNTGMINGAMTFGNGPTTVVTSGAITAPISFAGGNDALTLHHGGRVGIVDGGAGNDTLILALGGSDAVPDEVALSVVTGFEQTRVTSGVAALTGVYSTGSLDVAAGRLIGRAGSTITAPAISVAPGAVFGSAGTVVGTVTVGGTLSPGASPGTMMVTGNVALAAGSTSLFELTPAQSDQLVVSGTLTIASGANLTLTGSRPLTPGTPLDLIVAGGGISGSFTTITQAPTVLGFIRQSTTRVQLFGEFVADPSFAPGAARSVDYVNGLLRGGTASPALLAAVPSLLTASGMTNGPAFALLTPEVYASASRIGTENGLTLAHALRTAADQAEVEGGLFTFVQGVGASRQLRGDVNAARADVRTAGAVAGIGYRRGGVAVTAFGGYLDSRQPVGRLGARTTANGAVAGVSGTLVSGALSAVVTLAYDGSEARTTRTVPAGSTRSNYSLHGFVADGRLTYALPFGAVRLSPEVGVTHVATARGTVAESGSSAFEQTVAARTDRADFVDAAVRLAATRPAAFAPWASLGVRQQVSGRDRIAFARFGGGTSDLSAPGVGVAATVASAGAGANWRLSAPLTLYGAYRGEFARGVTGHAATLGLRFGF